MNKKYISSIVLAIVVIGVGVYFMRTPRNIPNPSQQMNQASSTQVVTTAVDTSGWETYRDEKFGYEVKYPKSIKFDIGDSAYGIGGINFCLDGYVNIPKELRKEEESFYGKGCFLSAHFTGQKINNPNKYSIEDWLLRNMESVIKDYYSSRIQTPNDKKYITIQGEPAFHLERADDGFGKGIYAYTDYVTFTLHNSYLYVLDSKLPPINPTPEWKAHPYYQYLEQSVLITNAIIGSFRFTK